MATSLSIFANEKTRPDRNEPEMAEMTYGDDEEKNAHPSPSCSQDGAGDPAGTLTVMGGDQGC